SHQSLGVMYYTLGRLPEALVETDRAIEIQTRKRPDPSVVAELRFNRGAVLWSLGRAGEAAGEWRAALEANPRHAQAREWLGVAERSAR
ncbi:MAG TPA: tetratricopeptide repeat protein, partial [Candidatus Saccharimonadales bacterium]|nr:tetratricopeptide repeat protein [Candidatus Saccharimonadales bacterium]